IALDDTKAISVGPFTIECRPTFHSVPTTAFRIRAGGRTLGFSADTTYDPALIDWLAAADLIVPQATPHPEAARQTPYAPRPALPAELRAKMRLIHYPDDFDIDASVIEPLREGRCYRV